MLLKEGLVDLVKKEPKTKAAKQAKQLGLRYMGFGRYAGKDGKIAFVVDEKTDTLVPYKTSEDALKLMDKKFQLTTKKFSADKKNKDGTKKIDTEMSVIDKEIDDIFNSNAERKKKHNKELFFATKDQHKLHKTLSNFYRSDLFSDDEIDAIEKYTLSNSNEINSYLYSGYTPNEQTPEDATRVHNIINSLDSAFEENETPITVTSYCGLSDRYKPESFKVGQTYTFKGYVSTSLSHKTATEDFTKEDPKGKTAAVLLQIETPSGSRGLYLGSISLNSTEKEFLLPRGSKIKVISGPHTLEKEIITGTMTGRDAQIAVFHCTISQDTEE